MPSMSPITADDASGLAAVASRTRLYPTRARGLAASSVSVVASPDLAATQTFRADGLHSMAVATLACAHLIRAPSVGSVSVVASSDFRMGSTETSDSLIHVKHSEHAYHFMVFWKRGDETGHTNARSIKTQAVVPMVPTPCPS